MVKLLRSAWKNYHNKKEKKSGVGLVRSRSPFLNTADAAAENDEDGVKSKIFHTRKLCLCICDTDAKPVCAKKMRRNGGYDEKQGVSEGRV